MTPERPILYGPNSPFDEDERRTIEAIYQKALERGTAEALDMVAAIRRQMACLEWLGEVLSEYPSPVEEQTLGHRRRELQTLVDTLSRTTPANYEFYLPTRALLGHSLVMAESNFYRLLRHICQDLFCEEMANQGQRCHLWDEATVRLSVCFYTKLAEEVLSAIATDKYLELSLRSKAVVELARIWESRLTYRVSDFFPILEATWEARQRVTAIGGTLAGTQEMFELFREGCDPRFVEYFARENPSVDEVEAFREFLFGEFTEELDRMARESAAAGGKSMLLRDQSSTSDRDPATVFYEFFGARHLQAAVRRLGQLPGPKHTAEAYVMIYYLEKNR